jgi:hypothetical protein
MYYCAVLMSFIFKVPYFNGQLLTSKYVRVGSTKNTIFTPEETLQFQLYA